MHHYMITKQPLIWAKDLIKICV